MDSVPDHSQLPHPLPMATTRQRRFESEVSSLGDTLFPDLGGAPLPTKRLTLSYGLRFEGSSRRDGLTMCEGSTSYGLLAARAHEREERARHPKAARTVRRSSSSANAAAICYRKRPRRCAARCLVSPEITVDRRRSVPGGLFGAILALLLISAAGRAQLRGSITLDPTRLAGTDAKGRLLIYATAEAGANSFVHWDTSATPSLLMEPHYKRAVCG